MESVPRAVRDRVAVEAAALHYVLELALAHPTLRAEYDRLAGTALATRRSPLERAIDVASGRDDAELQGFLTFAKDVLWDRAPDATREAIRAQVRAALAGGTGETVGPAPGRVKESPRGAH
ncbi:hypothetical protein [Rhodanobacter denitrificans]|uniref:Uncharacterized protein n=1 Tax=Rhodanobacter denitrificans TaxID=666685 RepID=M4NEC3_9GAMM|nr:hypothetical protein [Rhodanobacter denitrificans]AGG89155.1 hypothetical protein R2APBS1_2032 [Rhodanobacter denitrificans]UJJ52977.1 hypothetical protein LRK52_18925 [Rhodanobacter denitrificans]